VSIYDDNAIILDILFIRELFVYELWHFFAGLGLFLYGISRIEQALHDLGGRKFVKFLRGHTNTPLESIGSGAVLTAILQSSSLVSLMVLAFVGSRYIPMPNALGIIMGANLGTTFTGWIVAFFGFKLEIEHYALPILAVGALGSVFLLNRKSTHLIFMLIFGFGLLLFGLGFMKSGMESIVSTIDITKYNHYGIIYFFILGVLITAIIQSSSAMMAITLSALSLESISLTQAAATVIGADLGTTVTIILGSLSGAAAKKQVAFFHVVFNFVVDILALIFLPLLLIFIIDIINVSDPLFALVLFHNIFNAMGIILFLPMLSYLSDHIKKLFNVNHGGVAKYINSVDSKLPSIPLDSLENEVEHMIIQVIKYNMQILGVSSSYQTDILKNFAHYVSVVMSKTERYEIIKKLESEIISYSATLKNQSLSQDEVSTLLLYTVSARNLGHSVHSIKSIRNDLSELVRADDEHSYENKEELIKTSISLYKKIIYILNSDNANLEIEVLAELEFLNEQTHDKLVGYIYEHYSTDVSTPLNVVREIYSSNKALINSIKEYKLNVDKLSVFESFPILVR
jgi:phosphate:Na+ symporter